MAIDYDANLIAELYATQDPEKATKICDEMVKIGNAIFPRQIYEAYKKFQTTRVSHYFVSDLANFKDAYAAEVLKQIAHTTKRDADISMMVSYLTDIQYFDPEIVDKVKKSLEAKATSGEVYDYDLENYVTYLVESGENTGWLESLLQACFEDDREDMETRKIALKKLLKLQPKQYINLYYENYDSIRGKRTEIIF